MAKISDLVHNAETKWTKAKKDQESIERVTKAITTISKLAQVKGK